MNSKEKNIYLKNYQKLQIELLHGKSVSNDDPLLNYLSETPKHLYKYRECNSNNFNILRERYAWFSDCHNWNDERDMTLTFDIKADIKEVNKHFNGTIQEELNDLMQRSLNGEDLLKTEKILDIRTRHNYMNGPYFNEQLFNKDMIEEIAFENNGIIPINIHEIMMAKLNNLIRLNAKNSYLQFLKTGEQFKDYKYYCLSETYNDEKQWSIYAKNETGFCIEYDINSPNIDINIRTSIIPILYAKKKKILYSDMQYYMGNDEEETYKKQEELDFLYFKNLITKDTAWKTEKEWRVLGWKNRTDNKVPFDCVSALFLGSKITLNNQKKLISIANKLNVPVYKRYLDQINHKWCFKKLK